jgi:hypothetical protein
MCLEDFPMRQRPVKSPFLDLGFSSSSELEELLLEKLRSLREHMLRTSSSGPSSSCPQSGASSYHRPCCSHSAWCTHTC